MKLNIEIDEKDYRLLWGAIDDSLDIKTSLLDNAKDSNNERKAERIDSEITTLTELQEIIEEWHANEGTEVASSEGELSKGMIVTTMYVDRWNRLHKQIAIVIKGTLDSYTAAVRLYKADEEGSYLWINNYRGRDYNYEELCLEDNEPVFDNIRTTISDAQDTETLLTALRNASKAWYPSKGKVIPVGWYPREGDYFYYLKETVLYNTDREKFYNIKIQKQRRMDDDSLLWEDSYKHALDNGQFYRTEDEAEKAAEERREARRREGKQIGGECRKDFNYDQLSFIRDILADTLDKDIELGHTQKAEEDLEIINIIQSRTNCDEYENLDQYKRNISGSWAYVELPKKGEEEDD